MTNRRFLIGLGAVVVVALVVLFNSLYIVDQTSQALILQFGDPVRVVRDPGLKLKIPFIQTVVIFDRRLLDYDPPAEEVIASDQKRLVVDTYSRYRILDPLLFYRTVGSEEAMQARLDATISAALRRVIGNILLNALLSPQRAEIMRQIRDEVAAETKPYGIEVADVRIRHADLPPANSQAIYARMVSERQREAKQFRAQGYEIAQGIRAGADRDRTVILAEAGKQSQILSGQGDAQSIKIYADAFNQDPQFYAFYRSLEAYRTAFGSDSTFVLSPDSPFFKYFAPQAAPAGTPGK
jgi:membrane protease subunit HflC